MKLTVLLRKAKHIVFYHLLVLLDDNGLEDIGKEWKW